MIRIDDGMNDEMGDEMNDEMDDETNNEMMMKHLFEKNHQRSTFF